MSVRNNAVRSCVVLALASLACTTNRVEPAADQHADHTAQSSSTMVAATSQTQGCLRMLRARWPGSIARRDTESG